MKPTTGDSSALAIRHHTAEDVPFMRYGLVAVHVDAHAELLDQPFYSAEHFTERLDGHLKDPGFELVSGRVDGLLVGYAFGSTLTVETGWWHGIGGAANPDLTRETGSRTFAVREILVRHVYRDQGYAHHLLDALLAERNEERATLLVGSDDPARKLYRSWGWTLVGYVQPDADAPRLEVMVLELGAETLGQQ